MALTFNGSNSKLELASNLGITAFPFSFFCWIRPNSITTDQMVVGLGDFGGNSEAAMLAAGAVSGDPLRVHSRNASSTSTNAQSATGLTLATWQPALVVYRSATSRTVYFDTAASGVTNTANNALDFANFDRFVIGCRPISDTQWSNMDIELVCAWSAELLTDSWNMLRLGVSPEYVQPQSLIDYWPMTATGATQVGAKAGTVLTASNTATAGTSAPLNQTIPDTLPARSNGIWTWFTEPRAVHYSGSTYIGWVDGAGSVGITRFEHATKRRDFFILAAALQLDDHNNASIYIRPDGRIIAFYCKHNDSAGLRYRISTNAGDITAWGAEQTVGANTAYSNPRYLSSIGRLYVHFRVSAEDQYEIYSDDDGATWSSPAMLLEYGGQRPYVKSITNGVDRIDYYMTNGHPGETVTSLYHCMAKVVGGVRRFYKSDGVTEIFMPIGVVADCTQVHATTGGASDWNWDAKYAPNGDVCVLFARGVSSTDQRYMFSRLSAATGLWSSAVEICAGGAAFYAGEPDYAHGLCFDADTVNTVYVAIESGGASDIARYDTTDDGATWTKHSDITTGTAAGVKNGRPYAPLNAAAGMKLVWFKGTYGNYTNYNTDVLYATTGAGSTPATATTLSGPTTGTVGVASSNFTVGANGDITGTVTVTPSDGGGGGTFSPTSVAISAGTPAATFTYTAASAGAKTISISDNGGLTDASNITFTASAAVVPVAFTGTVPGQSATVGTPFSLDLASYFSGTQTPFTYALQSGTLPAGLSRTGAVISGTPTTAGASSGLVLRATDASSNTADSNSFTITVATVAPGSPPVVTSDPSNASVLEGANASFTTAATGALSSQWQEFVGGVWTAISLQTGDTLNRTAVALALNGRQYRNSYTNVDGTVYTAAATLTVAALPVGTAGPMSVAAYFRMRRRIAG